MQKYVCYLKYNLLNPVSILEYATSEYICKLEEALAGDFTEPTQSVALL